MLFRLNIEQRARQLGLMSAVGFSPGALRMLALREGMALAIVGGVIGLGGAIGYTDLIMLGLRTWWIGAVGTTSMTLHVVPLTLVYGLLAVCLWRSSRSSGPCGASEKLNRRGCLPVDGKPIRTGRGKGRIV